MERANKEKCIFQDGGKFIKEKENTPLPLKLTFQISSTPLISKVATVKNIPLYICISAFFAIQKRLVFFNLVDELWQVDGGGEGLTCDHIAESNSAEGNERVIDTVHILPLLLASLPLVHASFY
jgi:hypothetical protein